MDYKFNEDEVLLMLKNHILKTYDAHYSMNKIQSTEFIIDAGHGEGFCLGNIIKYARTPRSSSPIMGMIPSTVPVPLSVRFRNTCLIHSA